jgi:hypothetical protein
MCSGPQKYSSLLLRIQPSVTNRRSLFVTEGWMRRSNELYFFHGEKDREPPEMVRLTKHCSKLWVAVNTRQVKTLSHFHFRNICPRTLSHFHFLKICPRFHHARIVVHKRVRQELCQRLQKQVTSNWRLLEESPMSRTGLSLAPVPTTLVQKAGEVVYSDIQAGQMSISN